MRYARHLSLPEIGAEGQQRLRRARVLMVGAGGLGCPALQYLAAAGVGTIGIVDGDTVDITNLQRQTLYGTSDIGRPKVDAAIERLKALNSDVRFIPFQENLSPDNAKRIIRQFDVVIDGTDNFAARYLVNDACVQLDLPFIYGVVHRFEGQVAVFNHDGGPTYRCVFPDPPTSGQIPNCAEAGVLGVLPGIIGTLQATEAMKVILGIGNPLSGRMLVADLLHNSWQQFEFVRQLEQVQKAKAIDLHESYINESCTTGPAGSIQGDELLQLAGLPAGTAILDVRNRDEQPRISHAFLHEMPLNQLTALADTLDSAEPMLVVCQGGMRSQQAIDMLEAQGFGQLHNLEGGLAAHTERTVSAPTII